MTEGRIIKALSGFYYVQTDEGIIQCRGRGLFRKKKITPLVGDIVLFEKSSNGEGYIKEVKPRKSELIRPPVANIDQAILITSVVMPKFSTLLLDRFLAYIESRNIKPMIIINKIDLATKEELDLIKHYQKVYEKIGYLIELFSAKQPTNMEQIKKHFDNKISVFSGQSGVGKSSILNTLNPSLLLDTAHISKSLGRGKHTTRHVELMKIGNGLIADTPGFSSIDFNDVEEFQLRQLFPEMKKIENQCKFRGCLHHREPACAVKLAIEEGEIAPFRYKHYLEFLQEIQSRKPRY